MQKTSRRVPFLPSSSIFCRFLSVQFKTESKAALCRLTRTRAVLQVVSRLTAALHPSSVQTVLLAPGGESSITEEDGAAPQMLLLIWLLLFLIISALYFPESSLKLQELTGAAIWGDERLLLLSFRPLERLKTSASPDQLSGTFDLCWVEVAPPSSSRCGAPVQEGSPRALRAPDQTNQSQLSWMESLSSQTNSGSGGADWADWCGGCSCTSCSTQRDSVSREKLRVWQAGSGSQEPEDQPLIQTDLSSGSRPSPFMLIPPYRSSSSCISGLNHQTRKENRLISKLCGWLQTQRCGDKTPTQAAALRTPLRAHSGRVGTTP